MSIAVTGASGQLGRLTIEALKKKAGADAVVALVRDPAKIADAGVEARAFDYDQADALESTLSGVDTLILISSNDIGKRDTQHRNVILAAKAAGVQHILYTSLLHADTSPLSLADEHLATEADLKSHGVPFTILRNGWYTENYASSVAPAAQYGVLLGSAKDGLISAASRTDFAEALAVVATTDGHDGKVYELAGDTAWTLSDLAAEISRQSGKDVPYRDLPEADYAAALGQAGVPEGFAKLLAAWSVDTASGALFHDGGELAKLIGHPTTSFSVMVADALK